MLLHYTISILMLLSPAIEPNKAPFRGPMHSAIYVLPDPPFIAQWKMVLDSAQRIHIIYFYIVYQNSFYTIHPDPTSTCGDQPQKNAAINNIPIYSSFLLRILLIVRHQRRLDAQRLRVDGIHLTGRIFHLDFQRVLSGHRSCV